MKNLKTITIISLIACIAALLLNIADVYALRTIFDQYISPQVISRAYTRLPESTDALIEWQIVNTSFVARFFFVIFNAGFLIYLLLKVELLNKEGKMSKLGSPLAIAILASFVVFLFIITDFMALHDIFHDYASPQMVDNIDFTGFDNLPKPSETSAEWMLVVVGGIVRLTFLAFNIWIFVNVLKKINSIKSAQGE